jgi:hypothetical protein
MNIFQKRFNKKIKIQARLLHFFLFTFFFDKWNFWTHGEFLQALALANGVDVLFSHVLF